MSRTYTQADKDTLDLVREILATHYPAIRGMVPELQIGVLLACSDKEEKPALTRGGYPVAGQIRVISQENRAAGGPDVLITLDGDQWSDRSVVEQYALVHHQLHHIVPVKLHALTGTGAKGWACELDGLGRPRVRLRKHDFEIGGFNRIIEVHGDAAIEWQEVKRVHEAWHQQVLPFVKADATLSRKRG